jgi:hypothetical protein
MQQFAALVAFGVVFLAIRFITIAAFQQISAPPPGASRWAWWGTYVSILISLIVATYVMAMVDRHMSQRPRT